MSSLEEPRLPQEIFDNVIDHFHDDIRSLELCSFVASAWLATARAHLFRRVELNPPSKPKKPKSTISAFSFSRPRLTPCQRLYELIEASKRGRLGSLAVYVRELHLCEGMLAREWLAQEPMLPLLLRALPNLRRFEILRSASVSMAWNAMPKLLTGAVGHVFGQPSLTELRLSSLKLANVGELRDLLAGCVQLRVLEVDHLVVEDGKTPHLDESKEQRRVAPLDTLTIGPRTSTVLIHYLLQSQSTVSVSTVRKLSISISGDFVDFGRLLQAANSVEELEINLMNDIKLQDYWQITPEQQFDLAQITNLRDLKVHIDVLQKQEDPLQWLTAVLSTGVDHRYPLRRNFIETINIVYTLFLPAPYMDRSINTNIFDRWADIDAILCGRVEEDGTNSQYSHAYDNLWHVKLVFALENPIGFGVAPRFLKEVVLDSPGLEEKDILRIGAYDTSK